MACDIYATKTKTWTYSINQLVLGDYTPTNDGHADLNYVFLAMKNQLKTYGWQVLGSSDSLTAGMDGVDRLLTVANLVAAVPPTAHSWIVLQDPVTGTTILVDFNKVPDPFLVDATYDRQVTFTGAFAGGSTTAAPTCAGASCTLGTGVDGSNTYMFRQAGSLCAMHAMRSSDGKNTIIWVPGVSLFMCGEAVNTSPNWTVPNYCTWVNDISPFSSNSNVFCTEVLGTGILSRLTYFVYSAAVGEYARANGVSGCYSVVPAELVAFKVGSFAELGTVPDVCVSYNNLAEVTYPIAGTSLWYQGGYLIFPWAGQQLRKSWPWTGWTVSP